MKEITLRDSIFNKASSGSQNKWHIDNLWYKIDDYNYEGLSETIVSDILAKSNVKKYGKYIPETIKYKGKNYTGCISEHFLKKGERLLETNFLLKKANIDSNTMEINSFVDFIKEKTGLNDFDKYLCKMIELDMITLNTDRHFSNIAVIKKGLEYDYAPFFDQGRCFALRDDFWKDSNDPEKIIENIYPRLYSGSFENQTKEIEELAGGRQLVLQYGKNDLIKTLDKCATVYPDEILKRAEKMFMYQMDKHIGYFKNKEKTVTLANIKEKLETEDLSVSVVQKEDCVIVKPNYNTEIEFLIDSHKNVIPLKNGVSVPDEDLIFNYESVYNLYKYIYYMFHEERTGNVKDDFEYER